MRDSIEFQYPHSTNANLSQQAVFQAQQFYNKHGMGNRVVKSAWFVAGGGIEVEYELADPRGDEDRVAKTQQSNQAAIDAMSLDDDDQGAQGSPIEPGTEISDENPPDEKEPELGKEIKGVDGKVTCPVCGIKQYQDNLGGRRWLVKHMEGCQGNPEAE